MISLAGEMGKELVVNVENALLSILPIDSVPPIVARRLPQTPQSMQPNAGGGQWDRMVRLFFQYLAIYNGEILPKKSQARVPNFAKYQIYL